MARRVIGLFVFASLLGGMPSAVWAQQPFPTRGVEIVNALYAGTDPKNDDARKVAIRRTCEQMAADLGPKWGGKKRAGLPDDYRSPDSIAYLEDDGRISIWDIQLSSGAIDVFPGKAPNYPLDSPENSTFMPCQPTNHLGAPNPNPSPTPNPNPPPAPVPPLDLSALATKEDLYRLEAKLDIHEMRSATEREAAAEFRAQVKGAWEGFWKPVLKWGGMIGGPAIAGILAGMSVEQQK